MNKNKNIRKIKESGITLIALAVTIIVLLILVGVTLRLVLENGGIIGTANKAKADYKQSEQNETKSMNSYSEYMENSKYISFYIGNIEYTAERGMTWEEWTNSDYNTIGASIIDNKYVIVWGGHIGIPKDGTVVIEDRILENTHYIIETK